ncbi:MULTISPECIES: XdhC family protein [unclassified Sphingobacterium]|uniref:XdhC family protein n=1 Tax=unclassified Sphingobacterium TaxID=2609468 RepID=UPI0025E5F183|nr:MULTISPECIES: XdhC/CoxI family protein [unclassified Sphingobacterium]
MKEIKEIIASYQAAVNNNLRMSLATVVKVEGSSYRQPGARMLVTEDGNLTGAISGGCLEGDALRKALLSIQQRKNKLITYDTSNDEDAVFGIQLGCNGIVHILFEYIDANNTSNPVSMLKRLQTDRIETVVVTLFSTKHRNEQQGTVLISGEEKAIVSSSPDIDLSMLRDDINLAKEKKQSHLKKLIRGGHEMEALVEYIAPTVHLVIAGAGNDVKPLVEAAGIMGWETTVIDGRATHALPNRFPTAKRVILSTADKVADLVKIDPFTVFVLMTHNYHYDLVVLKSLIGAQTPYIGVLGPKTKLHRMFNELGSEGIALDEIQKEKIFGPMGLDIGAETSEEIAFSIVSEIKTILSGRKGSSLKLLNTKIHDDISILP